MATKQEKPEARKPAKEPPIVFTPLGLKLGKWDGIGIVGQTIDARHLAVHLVTAWRYKILAKMRDGDPNKCPSSKHENCLQAAPLNLLQSDYDKGIRASLFVRACATLDRGFGRWCEHDEQALKYTAVRVSDFEDWGDGCVVGDFRASEQLIVYYTAMAKEFLNYSNTKFLVHRLAQQFTTHGRLTASRVDVILKGADKEWGYYSFHWEAVASVAS